MFLPNKKLWLPGQDSKQPCRKNGYLQSASDARKWRDRFKRNPLAKVADMFIPKPLRMSPGYPCCCESGYTPGNNCNYCLNGLAPYQFSLEVSGLTNNECEECDTSFNGEFVLTQQPGGSCGYNYVFDDKPCIGSYYVGFFMLIYYMNPEYFIFIRLFHTSLGDFARWQNSYENAPECSEFNKEPFTTLTEGPFSDECNVSSSSCTLSAI